MALFLGRYRNPGGATPVTYQWFHLGFKKRVDELDIGRWVAHQARHTLATSLLRHGATLTHIRRYLGHVSDRMAVTAIPLRPRSGRWRPASRRRGTRGSPGSLSCSPIADRRTAQLEAQFLETQLAGHAPAR